MKFYTVISAYLSLCILVICQVLAHHEAQGNTETTGVCAVEMNVNRALHNYMMAICNRMLPGSMDNMNMLETLNIPSKLVNSILMMPDIMTETGQNLKARDVKDEAHPAQVFAPFPPFPPYPPFPPAGGSRPAPIAPVSPAPPRVLPPIAAPPVTSVPPITLPPITLPPSAEAPIIWIQPIWTSPPAVNPPYTGTPIFPPFPPYPPYPPSY